MNDAYAAIGRAVFFAQIFEMVMVTVFEAFKMQTDPGRLQKTGGMISAGAYKVAIRNIVKELSAVESIAPDLEGRLNSYINDRHQIIHRWVLENGCPEDNDAVGFAPLIALAERVESESKELSKMLLGYVLSYAQAVPELSKEEYMARVSQIFLRAHVV